MGEDYFTILYALLYLYILLLLLFDSYFLTTDHNTTHKRNCFESRVISRVAMDNTTQLLRYDYMTSTKAGGIVVAVVPPMRTKKECAYYYYVRKLLV